MPGSEKHPHVSPIQTWTVSLQNFRDPDMRFKNTLFPRHLMRLCLESGHTQDPYHNNKAVI